MASDSKDLKLEIDSEEMQRFLKSISKERLHAWCNYSFREEGEAFAQMVATEYLSGQKMKVRPDAERQKVYAKRRRPVPPHTRDAVGPYTQKRDDSIIVRPGVGIAGLQNYLYRFIGTEHEFMEPAWQQFSSSGRVSKAVEDNIQKMLYKAATEKGVDIR